MVEQSIPSVSKLCDEIMKLLKNEGLDDFCYSELLNYSLEKFKKQKLDEQYYGFHNVSHELVVTHNTLMASRGEEFQTVVLKEDFKHLFAAALFHDFEPDKKQDRPLEIMAADFVTLDNDLLKLFEKCGIDPHLVAILILRTTYPWESRNNEIDSIITEHFSKSKYSEDNEKQQHYLNLGWFLSVVDRIGAYALGGFLDALSLAKKNAHSLGWNPEYLVRESIRYFEILITDEREMTDRVIRSLPKFMGETFVNNVLNFYKLREKEIQVRADIAFKKIQLIPHLENTLENNPDFGHRLFEIFNEIPEPLQFNKKTFFESLQDPKTILITLRFGSEDGKIIGFAKGGLLENYSLIRSIKDENYGKFNTIFMEPLALEMGYWGHCGGPALRKMFDNVVKKQGYPYVTSLQLREVIQHRIDRHENIEFVQQLNPERLDYYRITL